MEDTSTGVPRRTLIWLAVATFTTGIDGYVLAGLLPQIAEELQVTAAAAGQLVAVFALTSAIAGPVLGALTSGWEQRGTIMGLQTTVSNLAVFAGASIFGLIYSAGDFVAVAYTGMAFALVAALASKVRPKAR